jgi:hypothetical protein
MNIRKLVLPAVIAAALATPAFAQQPAPQADASKGAQSQESRDKAGQKADAPKSDAGKAGRKDKSKADPAREPEEEDDR